MIALAVNCSARKEGNIESLSKEVLDELQNISGEIRDYRRVG